MPPFRSGFASGSRPALFALEVGPSLVARENVDAGKLGTPIQHGPKVIVISRVMMILVDL